MNNHTKIYFTRKGNELYLFIFIAIFIDYTPIIREMNLPDDKNCIQCNSCYMFWWLTPQDYNEVVPLVTNNTICSNCHDITLLKKQIDNLNETIFDLNNRITNLNKIRSLEDDTDGLSTQFGNVHINSDQEGLRCKK